MLAQFSTSKNKTSDFAEKVVSQFEGNKKEIKYICIDGRGENVAIEKMVESKGGITIKKTPPHTPQYNGRIERRFPIIISMAMAMLWAAGFIKQVKNKLFGFAVETAIFLHDIAPRARSKKSAYKLWYSKPCGWIPKNLVEFGRVGIVKIKDKHVKKGEKRRFQ